MSCLSGDSLLLEALKEANRNLKHNREVAQDREIQKLRDENEKLRAQLDMLIRILFDQIK